MNKPIFQLATKSGIIMGISFCIYTLLMWITKLDSKYLKFGQILDIVIILLPISIILLAIRSSLKFGEIKFVHRMLIAIYIGLLSQLIYSPFLYFYHNIINPDWFDFVLQLKINDLKLQNIPNEKIVDIVGKMKLANSIQNKVYSLMTFIPSVLILPSLIALFSLFFRNRNK